MVHSYLSDRRQLVDVSGTLSSSAAIACGEPHISILGSLEFLIYVNDMSGVVNHKLLLYADDSWLRTRIFRPLRCRFRKNLRW